MYVVQIVQGSSRFSASASSKRQQARQRSLSTDALNSGGSSHGVIYVQPSCETSHAAASDALSCQPTGAAVLPWLRQIALLIRTPEQQQLLPNVRVHCSANNSSSSTTTSSVLTASPVGTTTNTNSTGTPWGEGPDPLVIHLPGADGTAESSPADPASAGLPSTPTVVSNTNSLMLRGQASVQRRQPSELGFRPGSSGSKTLPSMLPKGGASALQHKASPLPASRPVAESKVPGPLGFLPALQWGNNIYWGSPIGGTLFINPPVEDAAGVQPEQQQQGKRRRMYWDSPLIGGTLFVNPSPDSCDDQGNGALTLLGAEAAAASGASGAPPAAAAVSGAASTASGRSSGLQGPPKSSKLPFLPPFQWGGPSKAQWGQYSLMGGTLYINPQAPADWEGAWGSGSNGFGSSSGGGAGGGGGGSSSSAPGSGAGAKGGSASSGGGSSSIGGVRSKQPGSSYVSAGAAHTNWGAVPAGMRLARLGVGLMAAMAAAALAMYLKAAPSVPSGNSSTAGTGSTVGVHGAAPAAAGGEIAAGTAAAAGGAGGVLGAAGGASDTPEGVGFHQWMVQRLQSTLEGFEAEQAMLKTELAMLNSMSSAGSSSSSSKGVLGGIRQWLGSSSSSSSGSSGDKGGVSSNGVPAEAAATAAVSGGMTGNASLSAADVSARVAEIQEQLESIEVLKAALSAEFAEQQQLLKRAQQQQQPVQDRLAALAVR